jgi:hypothetical protein
MTLKDAELIADEFRKLTLVESAEVVANTDGHWSVRLIAIFRNSSIAYKVLGTARVEEDFGSGEGNISVLCDRQTWLPCREEDPAGKVVKSEQSGEVVREIIFTGPPSNLDTVDGPPKLWTVIAYPAKSRARLGSFASLEEAVAFLESISGPHSD